MKNLIFIYYLLSFTTGSAGISFAVILFLKFKTEILIYYISWILLYTLNLILLVVEFYRNAFIYKYDMYNNLFTLFLFFSSYSLQFYIFPLLLHKFSDFKFRILKKIFFGFLTGFSLLLSFLPFIITDDQTTRSNIIVINFKIIVWIMHFINFYTIYFIIKNLRKIETLEKRILLKIILILLFIFIPVWLLEYTWNFNFIHLLRPLNSSFLHYFIWNFIIIILFNKYLFIKPKFPIYDSIPVSFLKKFNISSREKDVILFLSKGLANKQIAYELKISNITIKNHIYNIYKKTKAQSRVDLLNLINDELIASNPKPSFSS